MLKGTKMSLESRLKMSAVRKGVKFSEEHKKNMSAYHRTKHGYCSPLKGKKQSPEHIRKKAEATRNHIS